MTLRPPWGPGKYLPSDLPFHLLQQLTMADFLGQERKAAGFEIPKLIHLLDGGPDKHARKCEIRQAVEEDPVFSVDDKYYLSREEEYHRALKINVRWPRS